MNTDYQDQRLISRFVDGVLDGEERAGFERRLLAEPMLRSAVEAQRQSRTWLVRDAAEDHLDRVGVTRGFVGAVMARVDQLPSRRELLAEGAVLGEVESDQLMALHVGRRIMIVAALLFVSGLLVWGGVVRLSEPRTLEASDIKRIMELDTRFAAEMNSDRPGLRAR